MSEEIANDLVMFSLRIAASSLREFPALLAYAKEEIKSMQNAIEDSKVIVDPKKIINENNAISYTDAIPTAYLKDFTEAMGKNGVKVGLVKIDGDKEHVKLVFVAETKEKILFSLEEAIAKCEKTETKLRAMKKSEKNPKRQANLQEKIDKAYTKAKNLGNLHRKIQKEHQKYKAKTI